MSYAMTHLAVAKAVNDKLKIAGDLPQFFMGALAPDSVHFRENYHSDMKKKSHYIFNSIPWGTFSSDAECDEWLADVLPRIEPFRSHGDFYRGCLVHILTDIWNTRQINIPFMERCARENIPRSRFNEEQTYINLELFRTVPWKNEVLAYLAEAKGETVDDIIAADEVENCRDYILRDLNAEIRARENEMFVTVDDTLIFIENAADEISNLLRLS